MEKTICDNNCRTCTIDNRTYCSIETARAVFAETQQMKAAVVDLYNKIISGQICPSPNFEGENSTQEKSKTIENDKL